MNSTCQLDLEAMSFARRVLSESLTARAEVECITRHQAQDLSGHTFTGRQSAPRHKAATAHNVHRHQRHWRSEQLAATTPITANTQCTECKPRRAGCARQAGAATDTADALAYTRVPPQQGCQARGTQTVAISATHLSVLQRGAQKRKAARSQQWHGTMWLSGCLGHRDRVSTINLTAHTVTRAQSYNTDHPTPTKDRIFGLDLLKRGSAAAGTGTRVSVRSRYEIEPSHAARTSTTFSVALMLSRKPLTR